MRDYHRLDVGLTWSHYNRRNNKVEWNFSVYNLYNRHNPMFYYYNSSRSLNIGNPQWNHDFRPISLYQLSIFPVMPSFSYKVYFDPVARKARTASEKAIAIEKANLARQNGISNISNGSNIKVRWNIKADCSIPVFKGMKYVSYPDRKYKLEVNYGILDNIEAGIYGGYSKIQMFEQTSKGFLGYKSNAFSYGVNCNFQLLPYLVKKEDLRFDLYLTGKLGGITIQSAKSHGEYCLGGGATIYLLRHLGLFGEYNYGKFYNKTSNPGIIYYYPFNHNKRVIFSDRVTFGLSVKFK